jgi:membrane-associated phospholipid phosphatase
MGTKTDMRWRHELCNRWREHWALKAAGITLGITAFMGVYFALLEHPQFQVTTMPRTPIDHWIGFVPSAVIAYASLWLYIAIVPSLLHVRGEMARYLLAVMLVALIGCGIFYFWPTAVPAAGLDWARWPVIAWLKSSDASGNACPSLHVAFAVLTMIWLDGLLRRVNAPWPLDVANVAWCGLIVWSTLATRQHVALDVAAGAVLGAGVGVACLYLLPARMRVRSRRDAVSNAG